VSELTISPSEYSASRFLDDIRSTARTLDAPYSEETTRSVLDAFDEDFSTGAVLWRTTNRPGDALNYRFLARKRSDTVATAIRNGLLDPASQMIPIVATWSELFNGIPEQCCDFDAARGLAKVWLFLGGTQPADDMLTADGVPETVRRHWPLFQGLELTHCRHVAVDYSNNTVNLYFRARGPVTSEQAASFAALAGAEAPGGQLLTEMSEYVSRGAYTFAVTISEPTGVIERVAFYALGLRPGRFPTIGDRLTRFFSAAPSYDPEEMNNVGWSLGSGSNTYIKGERSYCGDLGGLMKSQNSMFSGEQRQDPALPSGKAHG
jgi:4-hydroxyphenylpyruvate 3-dimethylallyltransferase